MATWKKIIVSGSSAELAALKVDNLTSGQVVIGGGTSGNLSTTAINGTGNIVATTGAIVNMSGSFSGSFIGNGSGLTNVSATAIFPSTQLTPIGSTAQVFVSDGTNKYATVSQFTSASYAGVSGDITINSSGVSAIGSSKVTSAMIVDATIVDGDIAPNTITNGKLANSTISGISLGSNLATLTIGAGLNGTSYNGGTATTISVNSGSLLPFISGSIFSTISGDILIAQNGVAAIQPNAVQLATDISGFGTSVITALGTNVGTAGSFVVNGGALGTPSSGTLTNVSGLPISGLVSSTSTALGVGSLELGHASDTTFTRISAGVAAIEGNNIITANNFGTGILTFLGTPSSANLANAVTDETGTAGSVVFSVGPTLTGTTNVASLIASGDMTVTGNLSVAGTASFTNTDNLNIRDKFILINSGSSTLADSGWVTQYNSAGSGSAFYLEAASSGTFGRFAVAYDVIGTSTSVTADEYNVTAKINQASNPSAAPTWGGSSNGSGNMWVTNAGDIFIYG